MARSDWAELFFNRVVTHVPQTQARSWFLRMLGAELGPHVYLFGGCEVLSARNLRIAGNCHVGRSCLIDARGGITIGTNVVMPKSECLIVVVPSKPSVSLGA